MELPPIRKESADFSRLADEILGDDGSNWGYGAVGAHTQIKSEGAFVRGAAIIQQICGRLIDWAAKKIINGLVRGENGCAGIVLMGKAIAPIGGRKGVAGKNGN